ncbi:hypothetical protein AK812_SmicGene16408 [Symbiodinium microadriaticum]|uniref:Ubiquitin-like domain-containing protein n=1 Tax=Symbiodinium microadriaticum TaxID=2951 RepID=A0A1Q9E0F4_SYMMI|nr:hypothetical protein AK812_SmicGene16408 [Symbiodinium microadriaticum]
MKGAQQTGEQIPDFQSKAAAQASLHAKQAALDAANNRGTPAKGSTPENEKHETTTGSTPEDMSAIITDDVKVVEQFLKLLKEKKSAMKVASKGEKVNREDMINIKLNFDGATQVWRTTLGSKPTVKALMTAILHKHGVPEEKQEIYINGEGANIATMDRKSVLFNLMMRFYKRPTAIWKGSTWVRCSPEASASASSEPSSASYASYASGASGARSSGAGGATRTYQRGAPGTARRDAKDPGLWPPMTRASSATSDLKNCCILALGCVVARLVFDDPNAEAKEVAMMGPSYEETKKTERTDMRKLQRWESDWQQMPGDSEEAIQRANELAKEIAQEVPEGRRMWARHGRSGGEGDAPPRKPQESPQASPQAEEPVLEEAAEEEEEQSPQRTKEAEVAESEASDGAGAAVAGEGPTDDQGTSFSVADVLPDTPASPAGEEEAPASPAANEEVDRPPVQAFLAPLPAAEEEAPTPAAAVSPEAAAEETPSRPAAAVSPEAAAEADQAADADAAAEQVDEEMREVVPADPQPEVEAQVQHHPEQPPLEEAPKEPNEQQKAEPVRKKATPLPTNARGKVEWYALDAADSEQEAPQNKALEEDR